MTNVQRMLYAVYCRLRLILHCVLVFVSVDVVAFILLLLSTLRMAHDINLKTNRNGQWI